MIALLQFYLIWERKFVLAICRLRLEKKNSLLSLIFIFFYFTIKNTFWHNLLLDCILTAFVLQNTSNLVFNCYKSFSNTNMFLKLWKCTILFLLCLAIWINWNKHKKINLNYQRRQQTFYFSVFRNIARKYNFKTYDFPSFYSSISSAYSEPIIFRHLHIHKK